MTAWKHRFLGAAGGRCSPSMVQDPRSPIQTHQQSQLPKGKVRSLSRLEQLSVSHVFKRFVKVQKDRASKK
eukprot:5293154-Pyramimonas_sp.AAC.1